jgi:pimeloyl-ACP methyl ester carboxylesterase
MTDPRPSDERPHEQADDERQAGRARGGRRRLVISGTVLAIVVALLLANAAMVSRQSDDAAGSTTLAVDGHKINVRQDGPSDAPVLVLLHGLGASSRWWDPVVPMLATTYRVIRIDLLGHGRSDKPAGGGYAIPQQAARVGKVLDELGVEHAIVVGHSTGGYVATALAERRGELVTAIALVDTGPRMDAFVSDGPVGKLIDVPVLGQLLWRLRTDGLIRRGLSTAFAPGSAIPQQAVDDTRSMTFHALAATSHASDDYLTQRSMPDRLTRLRTPVLVIFGAEDQRWRPSSFALYDAVPGAEVEAVPGAGHSPMIEDPPRTAALLLAFASSVLGSER